MRLQLNQQIEDNTDEIFEKKSNSYQNLKNMLNEYEELIINFDFWGYEPQEEHISDIVLPPIIFASIVMSIFLPLMSWYGKIHLSIADDKPFIATIFLINFFLFCIRNIKFGLFKNRNKRFFYLKDKITKIFNEDTDIYNIILDRKKYLSDFENKINCSEEIKNVIKIINDTKLEGLKSELISFDGTNKKILSIQKKLNYIENNEKINDTIQRIEQEINEKEKIKKLNAQLNGNTSTDEEKNITQKLKSLL